VIVDCHAHWKPGLRSANGRDPSDWLSVLDRHGVTHAVVVPNEALADDTKIRRENDDVAAAAAAAAAAGRMIPFCTVKPAMGEDAAAEMRRCIETLGHRGLKLHPWLQGIKLNAPEVDRLCEMAARYEVPVLVHDGTPPSSLPSQVALLARRHPRTVFILGHCGLFEHWREAIAALDYAENLWGCLCGPHRAGLAEVVRRCDRRRLLWGSDFGFGDNDPVGYRMDLLKSLNLGEADMRTILCDNPIRLLKLSPASRPQIVPEPHLKKTAATRPGQRR
jgi:uncharacterized protein